MAEQAALNGYTNVVVEQLALGVADGTQETYFAASVGIGALPPADAQYVTSEAVDVKVATVDYLVAKHQLDHVDLLKVDTDGAELQILRGARTTLLNLKPILILELNPGGLGRRRDSIGELLQLLSDSGYRLLRPRFEKTCSVLARPPRVVGFERHPHGIQPDRAASANVVALLDGQDAHDAAALALGVPSG